jgi:hypothetical protein
MARIAGWFGRVVTADSLGRASGQGMSPWAKPTDIIAENLVHSREAAQAISAAARST